MWHDVSERSLLWFRLFFVVCTVVVSFLFKRVWPSEVSQQLLNQSLLFRVFFNHADALCVLVTMLI